MVSSCTLDGGSGVRLFDAQALLHFGRAKAWAEDDGVLFPLAVSCVLSLRLHACLLPTYDWLFSLMSASCLGLRPPAAITDG